MKIKPSILTFALAMLCIAGCENPKVGTDTGIKVPSKPALPELELPFKIDPLDKGKEKPSPAEQVLLAKLHLPHIELITRGRSYLDDNKVTNYSGVFAKQEDLGSLFGIEKQQQMKFRFREQPFSIAFAWTLNPALVDRMLYVAGRYPDKTGKAQMLVRPKSSLQFIAGKSLLRDPEGKDAKKSSLRPCTKFGLRNTIADLQRVYLAATKADECHEFSLGITTHGNDKRTCLVLARLLPQEKAEYPAKTTYILIDSETYLPLRIIGYDWDDNMTCDYQYLSIQFNPGLTDEKFSPESCKIEPPKIDK
ncbi:MAG: DUF1571 domain-containing protein [Phycisphaerales bacterium]|jgi:hypothetical protein|nr:DUF1571 domain-containing protein [Phycisphaerales bacterium]MBT7170250.1 DUF1571 domain-containing protein [Phycisphaerales bacterium]